MRNLHFPSTCRTPSRDRAASLVRVRRSAIDPRRGWLLIDYQAIPGALGRTGIKANKWAGDGATPRGLFRPVQLWWRADRLPRPRTRLSARAIQSTDAWCEDPSSRHYNRAIRLA